MEQTKNTEKDLTKIGITYSICREASGPIFLCRSAQVKDFLINCFDQDLLQYREEFIAVYLTRKNEILGYSQISTGATGGVIIDVKHIMQRAILSNCSAMIVAHNHPSGNTNPSGHDKTITEKLQQACKFFDINFIDSLIYASTGSEIKCFSFAEEGLI